MNYILKNVRNLIGLMKATRENKMREIPDLHPSVICTSQSENGHPFLLLLI